MTNKNKKDALLSLLFITMVIGALLIFRQDETINTNTLSNKETPKIDEEKLNKCLSEQLDEDLFSSTLNGYIEKLDDYLDSDEDIKSFYYMDLNSHFIISEEDDDRYYGASVIKIFPALYIYDLVSEGKTNLNEELTYTSNFYQGGTGIIKNENVGGKYTIKKLVELMIVESDNIAYRMLVSHYGMENIKSYWKEKGATSVYKSNSLFPSITAKDVSLAMEELYKIYLTNDEVGNELLNYFINSKVKFITSRNKDIIANKHGQDTSAANDAGIVLNENPYILIMFTSKGYDGYEEVFNKVSEYTYLVHEEYNNEKLNYCKEKVSVNNE